MTLGRRIRPVVTLALAVLAVTIAGAAPAASTKSKVPGLQFLGQVTFPTATQFPAGGSLFGGLSSIAYDERRDVYYSISDAAGGAVGPPRFYTLRVKVSDGRLDAGDVQILAVTQLLGPDGLPLAGPLDPEGLALTKDDRLVITSEGIANSLVDPWVRFFRLDGRQIGSLPVPTPFLPIAGGTRGVRQNLGFESASTAPNGRFLFTGTEGALVQDGPAASLTARSPARLLRYNLQTGQLDRQYVYWTETIAEPPVPPTNFAVNGLVELLPLNNEFLLSMERSFSVGAPDTGNVIKLFSVKVAGATNVNGTESLAATLGSIRAVQKTLLLDLDTLGIPLDNVEGMTFGPKLPDGRQSLLLVSDNNFATAQFTQFLLFAVAKH
jgi:hypothetical protein